MTNETKYTKPVDYHLYTGTDIHTHGHEYKHSHRAVPESHQHTHPTLPGYIDLLESRVFMYLDGNAILREALAPSN